MGNNVITKQIEELYVLNQILAPKYPKNEAGDVEMPAFKIYTVGANTERTKVYATVSLADMPFGEMNIYMLNYGKDGEIKSHDFIGKAGYHVAGTGQLGRIFEYTPKEEGNLPESRLKMLGATPQSVLRVVEMHVENLQQDFVSGKK